MAQYEVEKQGRGMNPRGVRMPHDRCELALHRDSADGHATACGKPAQYDVDGGPVYNAPTLRMCTDHAREYLGMGWRVDGPELPTDD